MVSEKPVPFTLSAEIFPLEERMVGMSLAVSVNFAGAGLLTLLVPHLSPETLLLVFFSLNIVAFVLVWIFVREVSAAARPGTPLSLESLFKIYLISTAVHFDYQRRVVLPYLWQRIKSFGHTRSRNPSESFLSWGGDRERKLTERLTQRGERLTKKVEQRRQQFAII